MKYSKLFIGLMLLGLLVPQLVSAGAVVDGNVSPRENAKNPGLIELGRIYLAQFIDVDGILSLMMLPSDSQPAIQENLVNTSNVSELALFMVNETNESVGNDIKVVAENISTTVLEEKFSFQKKEVMAENNTATVAGTGPVSGVIETQGALPEEIAVESATLEEKVFDATKADPVVTSEADPVSEPNLAAKEVNTTPVVQEAKVPEVIKTNGPEANVTEGANANQAEPVIESKDAAQVAKSIEAVKQNVTADPEPELSTYDTQEAPKTNSEVNIVTTPNGQSMAMLGSVGQDPSKRSIALIGREAQGLPPKEPLKLGSINNGGQVPNRVVNRANTLVSSVGAF